MLIQPLLFPPKDIINEPELFFRGVDHQNILGDKVIISAGSVLSLGTYFNSFSVGKWAEYTGLDNLTLHLKIQGNVEIEAYHSVGSTDTSVYNDNMGKCPEEELITLLNEKSYNASSEKIDIYLVSKDNGYSIKFNEIYKDGILYIKIKAIDNAVLTGGYYSTDVDESALNPVKIVIGICTFKREENVVGNVNRIIEETINNPTSPLKDTLEVYIADNGQTLDMHQFNSDKIHILPGPNLGGSGGFTRILIEAMFYDQAKEFTHIIFTDDDILFYPAVLERTYYLLQMLKPEYQKAILGAGDLLLEKPYIQQEAGAVYRDKTIYIGRANHKFFDLRQEKAVAANEVSDLTNYTGWWYACIPKRIITESNLPMPFFIHYDDAEYGIRNIKNKVLYLNGICIWHPSPAGEPPLWMTYYNIRNRLITMFSKNLSSVDFKKYLRRLFKQVVLKTICCDYENVSLILSGIEDFLKGPDAFISLDAMALHKELIKRENILLTHEEVGISREQIIEKKHPNLKKAIIIQLLCNLLPSKKKNYAINSRYFNIPYFADEVYIYNEKVGKGTINKRNQKVFFRLIFSFLALRKKLKKNFNQILYEWQTAKPILSSLSFWEKYLGLKKD